MGWEKITLRSAGSLAKNVAAVQDAFISVWSPMGAPPDAALYSSMDASRGSMVCEIYLNPVAAEIARRALAPFHPEPVEPPSLGELHLAVFNTYRGRPRRKGA